MSPLLNQSIKTARQNKVARRNAPLVLHICTDLGHSDPGREVVDLALQLQRRGWRNLITTTGGVLALDAERAAININRMPLSRGGYFAAWQRLRQLSHLIKRENPSLIHCHVGGEQDVSHIYLCYNLSKQTRIPLLLDIRYPLAVTERLRKILTHLAGSGSMIRVPSEYMGYYLHREFGLAAESIYYAPSGIDLSWFNNPSLTAERLQRLNNEWRLPEQVPIILFAMPFIENGGYDAVLDYLTVRRDQPCFAVLLGHDQTGSNMRCAVEQRVISAGLGGKVVMPESCPDWPAALWLSNLVVSYNTQPMGEQRLILAAQAMGRPVIVSDCGANRELLPDDAARQIVAVGDQGAFTAALDYGLSHLCGTMAASAEGRQDFIANRYGHDAWLQDILGLYDRLTQPQQRIATAREQVA